MCGESSLLKTELPVPSSHSSLAQRLWQPEYLETERERSAGVVWPRAGAANRVLIDTFRGGKNTIQSWQLDEARQRCRCHVSESQIGITSSRLGAWVDTLTLTLSHVSPGVLWKVVEVHELHSSHISFEHFRKLMTWSWSTDRSIQQFKHVFYFRWMMWILG